MAAGPWGAAWAPGLCSSPGSGLLSRSVFSAGLPAQLQQQRQTDYENIHPAHIICHAIRMKKKKILSFQDFPQVPENQQLHCSDCF